MKVLIVAPYFYPAVGGVENYVLTLANGLVKEYGHEIVVITTSNIKGKVTKTKVGNIKVYRLPYTIKLSNTPIGFSWRKQLKSIIKSENPDIINAHTPVPFMADMASRASGNIPFILTYHNDLSKDTFLGKALAKLFYVLLLNRTMKISNRIIVTSSYYAAISPYLKKYKNKLSIVSPGVDTKRFNENVDKKWLKKKYPNKKIVLFVGSLNKTHKHKGIDILIKAIAQLEKSDPNIQLIVIGKGDAIPEYIEQAKKLNLSNKIDFTGFVPNQELPRYFAGSDIFVLPSTNESEGFGMVLTEAMASETAVIGTRVGGIPFVIDDNKTGLLVGPNDHKALSLAISKLLQDDSLREMLVAQALDKARTTFEWNISIKKANKIYKDCMHQSIAHVVAKYPPSLGGMENVVQTLVGLQQKEGLDVQVITSNIGARNKKFINDSVRVERLNAFEIAHTPIIPGLLKKLLFLRKRTIIHIHVAQAFVPEMVWLASKIKGYKYIAHVHLDVPASGPAGFLLKIYKPLILKHVLRGADFVIVFTKEQKELIASKYSLNKNKIKVISNGIGNRFYYDKKRILTNRPTLLFVGRLTVQKNLDQLFYGLEGISDQFITNIVGEGELRGQLKDTVKKLRLKNVNFVGRADGDKLLKYYKEANIFVLTSTLEGMPLVLLEAMAMGLPIVATQIPGNKDVVKNKINGFLIPVDDTESLKIALRNICNPKLYKYMSDNSYEMSKKYSWDIISKTFNSLYKKLET